MQPAFDVNYTAVCWLMDIIRNINYFLYEVRQSVHLVGNFTMPFLKIINRENK